MARRVGLVPDSVSSSAIYVDRAERSTTGEYLSTDEVSSGKTIGYTAGAYPEKVTYTGQSTSTADVIVDNDNLRIGVNVNTGSIQKKLIADTNINITEDESGNPHISATGELAPTTWEYIGNKPQINNKDLKSFNNTLEELGIASQEALDSEGNRIDIIEEEISDLGDIRAKANSAVQPEAISDMATQTWTEGRLSNYRTSSDQDVIDSSMSSRITTNTNDINTLKSDKVDKVNGKGLSTNDFDNEYKANVDSNTSARHTHTNKSLLDTYDQTNDNISDAVSKKHDHNNKEILDSINTQTAYSSKGSGTKVAQITTNTLGQVTKIDEVDIVKTTLSDLGITATAEELNYTDGVTSNIQTQLNSKQPNLPSVTNDRFLHTNENTGNLEWSIVNSGVTGVKGNEETSFREGNVNLTLDNFGVTASKGELNVLDGITATTAELNYTDGVTSNIQTQLNSKQGNLPSAVKDSFLHSNAETGELEWSEVHSGVTGVKGDNETTYRTGQVNLTLGNFGVDASATELNILDGATLTTTELNYVDGVTSSVQSQLNNLGKRIDDLPSPMVFKGTLGTGGTISELPETSTSTIGHTYKVITAGTYAGQSAKVGDLFTCNDSPAWVLIPSGDEPSGTVTNIATGTGLTGGPITSTGTISVDNTVVPELSTENTFTNKNTFTKTFDRGTTITTINKSYWDGITVEDASEPNDYCTVGRTNIFASHRVDEGSSSSPLIYDYSWALTYNSVDYSKYAEDGTEIYRGSLKYPTSSKTGTIAITSDISLSNLGITASSTEINKLDGLTATTEALNYVDATSSIQDQLDNKEATIDDLSTIRSGAALGATALQPNTAITGATHTKITYDSKGLVTGGEDLTANDIPNLNANKITEGTFDIARIPNLSLSKVTDVTATSVEVNVLDGITATTNELNYTHGVRSAIQDQIDTKSTVSVSATGTSTDNIKYITVDGTEKRIVPDGVVYYDSEGVLDYVLINADTLDGHDSSYFATASNTYTKTEVDSAISSHHDTTKQDTLVSGTNIKTINNGSILGSGNIDFPTVDQTYDATSTNAQSGVAIASGISSYDNYTTLSIPITGWTSSTLESETVYTYTATLSGATSGKHPLVSLSPTKPSTMEDENEMFSQIIKVQEGSNTLTITSSAIPTTAYTLQVKNY